MGPIRTLHRAVFLVALAALASVGCKVTSEDVDTWKGTVKGPGKMVAVTLAEKYDIELRTYAALGLVDMERQDVDGVAELQHTLKKVDAEARSQIIDGLVPGLVALMKRPSENADPHTGPAAHQIRGKDAAFLLIASAAPATQKKLTKAVINWYIADFNGRSLAGNYSAEQVVRALGSPAATILVDALEAKLPQQALTKLAELIGQLGNPKAKARAGKKLVDIELEMESEKFLSWLKGEIKQQFADAGEKNITDKRIMKAALLNREKFIGSGALPAMKHLADQAIVVERLLKIASDKTPAFTVRRTRALMALEGNVQDEHLEPLLALALDAKSPATVRDYAFDRVGDIRSPKAIEPMWPLVQSGDPGQQRLRWRAGELVLAIGGKSVLAEFFAKLPSDKDVKYEPEELEGYAQRMAQMAPLPIKMATAQLRSPDWWNQIIALRFFERKGTEADIKRMKKLKGSSTVVKGKNWKEGDTVGSVAVQAMAGLTERLKHASSTEAKKKTAE